MSQLTIRSIRLLLAALLAALFLASPQPAAAGVDDDVLEKQQPVAIVAGVQGDAQIKIGSGSFRKCFALDLVRPTTEFKTGADGAIIVIYLYDDHRELMGANSAAKADYRNLTASAGAIKTEPKKSGGTEFEVPYITKVKLNKGLFAHADDPNEAQKEQDYLSAYVDVTQSPPSFHWRDLKTTPYRIQLFDEKQQFIFEKKLDQNVYKFPDPRNAPVGLTKTAEYYWQVLAPGDNIVVSRYAFRLLTLPLVKYVARQEKEYDAVQAKKKGDTVSSTELFLVFNQYRTLDKGLHLLQTWREAEPTNPNVYRYLCRAYVLKGCPLNARQALQQEIQLGGTDPVQP